MGRLALYFSVGPQTLKFFHLIWGSNWRYRAQTARLFTRGKIFPWWEHAAAYKFFCRSDGGSVRSSSPSWSRSSRENAAHFHTALAPDSRGGTAPCAKPSPALRAPPSPPARSPPPTRSAADENPAAIETSPCLSSSKRRCRVLSPALHARHGRLPSRRQTLILV